MSVSEEVCCPDDSLTLDFIHLGSPLYLAEVLPSSARPELKNYLCSGSLRAAGQQFENAGNAEQ
jgi:hypothetical protein